MIELKDDCYARRLEQQNAELLAMLKRLEWAKNYGVSRCAICGWTKFHGHYADCELAAMLKKAEGKP